MADIRVTVPNDFNFIIPTSTDSPLASTGFVSLVQIVIKTLLTTPGKDVFAPEYGAGLVSILRTVRDPSKLSSVRADVGLAIIKAVKDIQNEQDSDIDNIPPEGRLLNLTLEGLKFLRGDAQWCVEIGVQSEAGDVAVVGAEL